MIQTGFISGLYSEPETGDGDNGSAEPGKSQFLRAYPKKNEPQTTGRVSGPLLIVC